jgi:ATP-binding cassette subfamily F protein 3
VGPFSGGEKARLALALVAFRRPNLLLLDEPTNHLDLEMRQALAMALQEYTGAVVMVSHDRHLLATVTDRFLLVDGGRVQEFDGDLDDYARWLTRSAAPDSQAAPATPKQPKVAPKPAKPAAERRNLSPLRSRLARVEKRMGELAQLAKDLDAQLSDPALYGAAERGRQMDLTAQRARVAQETGEVETEWLEISEELERATG